MALVNCKECQHSISDNAEECSACGAPTKLKAMKSGSILAMFTLAFTLVAICMPMFLAQALIPLAGLLSIATLFKRRFIIGAVCLALSAVGMSAVAQKQAELQKGLDQLKNIGK